MLLARGGPQHSAACLWLTPAEAASSIRISFSPENTEEDVKALLAALGEGVGSLVRIKH